ncbi:MAG: phosphoribosylformylglycinamidine cyclo-ligase [Proteobacteria bacterium]|nr:phosphoribosylformylglycinamidine cyclo-ligase [Pseudomonadota bacterium]
MKPTNTITYKDAGVDIDEGEAMVKAIQPIVASAQRPEVMSGVGGFAALVALPTGYREPILVAGTDGVGTKLKIAFEMNRHDTIGIDLVAMCANDVLAMGAESLFFLDYYACSALRAQAGADVVAGIAEGCQQAGAALVGGETAELPGFYKPGEYDLAGFMVGVVEKEQIVTGAAVQVGDAVIGLSSSGLHSNGYSLARRVVENSGLSLSEAPEALGETLGEALLRPTTIYVRPVRALMEAVDVRAIAHITGGGLLENIPRTLPKGMGVALQAGWPVPPIFRWLAQHGPIAAAECHRVFNMGLGMTLVVPEAQVARALDVLSAHQVTAQRVGQVVAVPPGEPRVTIAGEV